MDQRLLRSRTDRMIFGVCAGLARYFEVDVTLVRVIFVLLAFASGIGVLAYIVMAIITPVDGAQEIDASSSSSTEAPAPSTPPTHNRRSTAAIILILVGVLMLLSNLGLLWWFDWNRTWPIVLIAIGLFILLQRSRRS